MQKNKENKRRIVLTGGHLTPALAVIEELKKKGQWDIYYLGVKYSFEGKKILSEEAKIIPQKGVSFVSILAGRFQRKLTLRTIPALLKIPIGFCQSLFYLKKIDPEIILSFGSYVSVPTVVAAWILKIPIVIHEQTAIVGLANKINVNFTDLVAVTYEESFADLPAFRKKVVGNPVRGEIFAKKITAFVKEIEKIRQKNCLPIIYVTGGNQGSMAINKVIFGLLKELLPRYLIIHQTGALDYQRALREKSALSAEINSNYFVRDFIFGNEIGWVLNEANLVISRAGANIVYELGVLKKKAVLIPLPFAGGDEQFKNALRLEKVGLATIVEERNLDGERLSATIEKMFSLKQDIDNSRIEEIFIKNGAKNLVNQIEELLEKRKNS